MAQPTAQHMPQSMAPAAPPAYMQQPISQPAPQPHYGAPAAQSMTWPTMPQPGAYAPQTASPGVAQNFPVNPPPTAEYAQPIAPAGSAMTTSPVHSLAIQEEGPVMNLNGSAAPQVDGEKPLPRDLLLQKVRQYRESQARRAGSQQPEQLSMDVEGPESSLEAARRLASEIVRSPFDPKNLDVPTFLRRKSREEESENPTV